MQVPALHPPPAPPALLARAIFELAEIGAPVTPLAVVSRLTDLGASNDEVRRALEQLAAAGPTEDAA